MNEQLLSQQMINRKRVNKGTSVPVQEAVSPVSMPVRSAKKTISDAEIAQRAYSLYEKRGCKNGHAWNDWLEAERQLREEYKQQGA